MNIINALARNAGWAAGLGLLALALAACAPEKETGAGPSAAKKIDLASLKAGFPFRGKIVFQSNMDGDNEIYLLTANSLLRLTDNTWSDEYPRWSPDGTRIAFTSNSTGNYDIFTMSPDGSGLTQITNSAADEVEPAWLPDGASLAFTKENKRLLGQEAVLKTIDLKTKEIRTAIPEFKASHGLSDYSPLQPLLTFTGHRLIGWDVFLYDLQEKKYAALTEGGKNCRARFSKDGRTLAYVSSEADGKGDIWIMNPDGTHKRRLTERNETYDYFPSWAPDGDHIVFCSSTEHSPKQGRWSLYLLKVGSRLTMPLFSSGARDLFPDWQ